MKWADIEKSASEYKQLRNLQPQSEKPPEVNLVEFTARKQAEINEIIERFRIKECLEAIASDVWGEGQVSLQGTGFGGFWNIDESIGLDNILYLYSNEFTEIYVTKYPDRGLRVNTQPGEVGLSVSVEPDFEDGWMLEINSYSIFNLTKPPLPLREDLQKYSFDKALVNNLELQSQPRITPIYTHILVDSSNAEAAFHSALVSKIESQRQNKTLPVDIRAWCNNRLAQLPSDWFKNGSETHVPYVEQNQIMDLVYDVKKTPGFIRSLNPHFGYRLPI